MIDATVRGIVAHHEGTIAVRTKPGHGTTFQILLPASPNDEAANTTTTTSAIPRGRGVNSRGRRRRERSWHHGGDPRWTRIYRVLTASDGTEALALFAPRNLEVRAIVTDLDMPSLDGTALAKVVHALNPKNRRHAEQKYRPSVRKTNALK